MPALARSRASQLAAVRGLPRMALPLPVSSTAPVASVRVTVMVAKVSASPGLGWIGVALPSTPARAPTFTIASIAPPSLEGSATIRSGSSMKGA